MRKASTKTSSRKRIKISDRTKALYDARDKGQDNLAARGNSHSPPEKSSSGAISGVPRCPTLRHERVVAPLSAMRFGGRSRFSKALTITTGC